MKRFFLILVVLAVVVGGWAFFSAKSANNTMVELKEAATAQWSQVENVYERRAALIPNLVATAEKYAEFEQETFTEVAQARKQVSDIVVTKEVLNDPEMMKKFSESQSQLTQALSRFLSIDEKYPELQSNKQFENLAVQLEGSENRIANERRKFITATQSYNTYIKKFPNNIWAGLFNFDAIPNFEAQQGAENAPDVSEMFNK